MATTIVIQTMPPEMWWRLEGVFHEHHVPLPNPEYSRILVALDGETIAGFVVIQLQPHIEPVFVVPAYRHRGLAGELAAAACALFQPGVQYYAFSPRDGISKLATRAGLEAVPWKIFRGKN